MKKIVSVVLTMMLSLGVQKMVTAETRVPPGTDVVAVYAQQSKQPFARQGGVISFLDTVWIYLSDNSFVQYAFIDEKPFVFSKGVYHFENGSSFLAKKAGDNQSHLVIKRTAKFADKKGLKEYKSERRYELNSLGFQNLFCLENKGKKIVAIFAGQNKQPYGDSRLIDTYWIFYDDMTFNQYACSASDPILFSEGTYSLSDGADFDYSENKKDYGKITITRSKKLKPGFNYANHVSSHTYALNTLGFELLVLDKD